MDIWIPPADRRADRPHVQLPGGPPGASLSASDLYIPPPPHDDGGAVEGFAPDGTCAHGCSVTLASMLERWAERKALGIVPAVVTVHDVTCGFWDTHTPTGAPQRPRDRTPRPAKKKKSAITRPATRRAVAAKKKKTNKRKR